MELARLDQASSAPSSTKSLGLEKGPLPRLGRVGYSLHWLTGPHLSLPQQNSSTQGSLCPTSLLRSPLLPPGPALSKATCRKEGS